MTSSLWRAECTRFIVVTRSRTGSNMLMSFLNSHPEIKAKGELLARLKGVSHSEILEQHLAASRETKAVGFKLFYYHPMDHGRDGVWQNFITDRSIKIIHLKRKNRLLTCLSRIIAENRGYRSDQEGGRRNVVASKAVTISHSDLKVAFEQTERWEDAASKAFSNHPYMEIYYEELIDSLVDSFHEIVKFLSVSNHIPTTKLVKQNPEPASQLILNYHELRESFRQTKWQWYFDE